MGRGRSRLAWVLGWYVQVCFHLLEGRFGLVEEVEDDACAELALFFVIVHFEDLDCEVSMPLCL